MSWLAAQGYHCRSDADADVDEGRTADAVFELSRPTALLLTGAIC